jgi:hypothetical protein
MDNCQDTEKPSIVTIIEQFVNSSLFPLSKVDFPLPTQKPTGGLDLT